MSLWSDGKSDDEIEQLAASDRFGVIYNLLEDIQCLKEDIERCTDQIIDMNEQYEKERHCE